MIAGGIAGVTLDPERLLWVPGARTISIPKLRIIEQTILINAELEIRFTRTEVLIVEWSTDDFSFPQFDSVAEMWANRIEAKLKNPSGEIATRA